MYLKLYSSLILFFLCSGLSAQNTNQYPDFKLYFGSKNDVENFYSCEYEFSPLMMPEKLQDIETKSFQKEIILYKNSVPKDYYWHSEYRIPKLDFSYQKQNGVTEVTATSNGFQFYKASYKNGLLNGKITFFFVEGMVFQEFEFKNGMANGLHKMYTKEGRLILETLYKNNVKNGTRKYYPENRYEQICMSGTYQNGILVGDITYTLSDNHYYTLPNDLEKGTFREFYNTKLKTEYTTKTRNNIEGYLLQYYQDTNNLQAKIPYSFGVINGICNFYDTNGAIYNTLEYKNGKKIGTHKNITEKGKVNAEEYYDNEGKKTGTWKQYNYNTAELTKETNYLNDSIHGAQTTYYKGKIESVENYNNGTLETKKVYDTKNEYLKAEYTYARGKIQRSIEYLPSGVISTQYQRYPNNTAVQTFYDLQGNILTENHYNKQDQPIGIHKNYNYYSGEPYLNTITEYDENNTLASQTYYFQNGSYNISRYKNQRKYGAQTQYNKTTNTTTTTYYINDKKVTQEEFEKNKNHEEN